ncbi:pilus assembly protein Flp/PilA [Mariprofundus aestuarium]|uniref:Pilus assembly protein Flp/PilA n=1 Tax=Mariprofundus aestuarium TaxID=1921086 RepID=A0A2K8KYC9_MARES|nr:Flp family type IVb pilin [Mariprofundus aestuarium]ATX79913.1 pilus assembly protein Flp/PilA [Mariprofundus aestuarium]
MRKLYTKLLSFIPDVYVRKERGATMVEYAILVALISIAAITVIIVVGEQVNNAFNAVADAINQ